MLDTFSPQLRLALADAVAAGNAEALRPLTRSVGGTLDRNRLEHFASCLTYWIDYEMVRRAAGVPKYSRHQWVAHQSKINQTARIRVEARLALVQAVVDGQITTYQIHQYIMGGGRLPAVAQPAA
jgi:hypothetical protein